jgi:hypothetical protein
MQQDTFTDTVNFRCLASELRKQNHTAVPEREALMRLGLQLGIRSWVERKLEECEAGFTAMLAFHMMDVGDQAA